MTGAKILMGPGSFFFFLMSDEKPPLNPGFEWCEQAQSFTFFTKRGGINADRLRF